jgi:hypothetical protein
VENMVKSSHLHTYLSMWTAEDREVCIPLLSSFYVQEQSHSHRLRCALCLSSTPKT